MVGPYSTWLVAGSSVVQVIAALALPVAWTDISVINGATLSMDRVFSADGTVDTGEAPDDSGCANGLMATRAPPIIAAKQISPTQTISHLFTFLMRTSVGCKSQARSAIIHQNK